MSDSPGNLEKDSKEEGRNECNQNKGRKECFLFCGLWGKELGEFYSFIFIIL